MCQFAACSERLTSCWPAPLCLHSSRCSFAQALLYWLTSGSGLQEVREALVTERERLYEGLQSIPFLEPYPSHSNFVLSLVKGLDAKGIKDRLAQEHGIIIRHYSKPELSKYIRISVGKPEHTDAVLQALRAMQ